MHSRVLMNIADCEDCRYYFASQPSVFHSPLKVSSFVARSTSMLYFSFDCAANRAHRRAKLLACGRSPTAATLPGCASGVPEGCCNPWFANTALWRLVELA